MITIQLADNTSNNITKTITMGHKTLKTHKINTDSLTYINNLFLKNKPNKLSKRYNKL